MIPAEVIRQKRNGNELSDNQIRKFVQRFADSQIPDYQMSALAMAIYFQGMTDAETTSLTRHMLATGARMTWDVANDERGSVADKHSTGGIGDKVSIVLAPLLASVGFRVPMISGRGLGPTGGTLDKLESIPRLRTDLTVAEIQTQVESIGCAITGATEQIVPADRKLYALRDVTATVESIPLITASILSKKLAESLDSLVLDVKCGSGSLMTTYDEASALARSLVRVGNELGVNTTALLTDMNQPLGRMVGNAVELWEAIDCLRGGGPRDLRELVITISSQHFDDPDSAVQPLAEQLDNGEAYSKFQAMVRAQGGDIDSLERPRETSQLQSRRSGVVQSIDGRAIGNAIIQLGGGRRIVTDEIDHHVGLEMLVRIGDHVDAGQPIVRVYANRAKAGGIRNLILAAVSIDERETTAPPLIIERVNA